MATIKGQNLRLTVAGQCVARARTCTVHIAMQSESSSTKDDDGDWENNAIVGMSWDASCEAEVSTHLQHLALVPVGTSYRSTETIELKAGDSIGIGIADGGNISKGAFYKVGGGKLGDLQNNTMTPFTAEEDMSVYVVCNQLVNVIYSVTGENAAVTTETLLSYMESKVSGEVTFDYTGGNHNRETEKAILRGQAFITDISIQAQNRQTAVCTIQLTGTRELEIVNE